MPQAVRADDREAESLADVEPVRPRFHQTGGDERRRTHAEAPRDAHRDVEACENVAFARRGLLPPREDVTTGAPASAQDPPERRVLGRREPRGEIVQRSRATQARVDGDLVDVGEVRDGVAHVPVPGRRGPEPVVGREVTKFRLQVGLLACERVEEQPDVGRLRRHSGAAVAVRGRGPTAREPNRGLGRMGGRRRLRTRPLIEVRDDLPV